MVQVTMVLLVGVFCNSMAKEETRGLGFPSSSKIQNSILKKMNAHFEDNDT
jgi:hypothetical protein